MIEPQSTRSMPAGWIVDAMVTTLWLVPAESTPFVEGRFDALDAHVVWTPRKHREARTKLPPCILGRPRPHHGLATAALLEIRSRITLATALSRLVP